MRKYPYNLDEYNIQERRITTNGIELNVFEAGSGPLVFLLHGFPECWASWGPQITHLVDRGYRVVAPEMRGYGGSDAPENVEAYDTLELAADVAGLIDAYGGEPAVVIGHDWGCIVAWHVAWLYPEKLAGYLLNTILVPWLTAAQSLLTNEVSSAADVDKTWMLSSRIKLIPRISNQHSHPDKRNRFCRDSSDALGSYSLRPGGQAVAEFPGSCFAFGLNSCLLFDGLILAGYFTLQSARMNVFAVCHCRFSCFGTASKAATTTAA
jgi:pimeloyl-ACP methyl ester carboxylesterase